MRGASEFAEVWVVHFQRAKNILEDADRLQGAVLVATPEQPFDTGQDAASAAPSASS